MRHLLRNNRIGIALLLLTALLLTGCGAVSAPQPTEAPPAPTEPPEATPEPMLATVETPVPIAETPEPTATPAPATASDLSPAAPTEPVKVDDTYFQDAAFLGNSLMDGLRLFGGLKYGDFYAGTSASVISVTSVRDMKDAYGNPCTRIDALLKKQYNKIYVLFGINEMGFNTENFISIYSDVLARIAEGEPNAKIFVLSLTPITQRKDVGNDLFKRERILEFNRAIAAMAEKNGYVYLNLYDALADENGWLPENQATDGIHFTGKKYPEWADFLRTHTNTDDVIELE